ncbi:hypothetical protein HPP92_015616 [Vanilla planifolia]|uniref:Uncharacterized protein n=1 Tax=Vanilla planifolia TaxID=51239 RepID=A0A835USK1_VANPL|nr:hypothetical protein HPP92_016277 [Vanilla planifolia]KAG0471070.1 hypothetical protein HPP92_015616 [Vanilla planifolia]
MRCVAVIVRARKMNKGVLVRPRGAGGGDEGVMGRGVCGCSGWRKDTVAHGVGRKGSGRALAVESARAAMQAGFG